MWNYDVIGFIMLIFSIGGGRFLAFGRGNDEKSKQVKWALFVLYFWVLNFMALILLALVYKFA